MNAMPYNQVPEVKAIRVDNILIGEKNLYRSADGRVTYTLVGTNSRAVETLVVLTKEHMSQITANSSALDVYQIWTTAFGWAANPTWHDVFLCLEDPLCPTQEFIWEDDFRCGSLKLWGHLLKDAYSRRPKTSTEGLTWDEYYNTLLMFRGLILSPDSVARDNGLAIEQHGWNIPSKIHMIIFATLALTLLATGTEKVVD